MLRLNRIVATVGGIGYLPFAPGTFAAALAALIWYLIPVTAGLNQWQLPSVVAVTLFGVYSSAKVCVKGVKDPSYVVIDEWAGMWISLLFLPPTVMNIIIAFILFRFFDIAKPLGIRKMEKQKNGWGIMLDDVLAGIYSNFVLRLLIVLKLW
jgi:phosphatidylglycerophosphatase A